jgi:23S rRNA (guanosine2251-2'-O)-methyltransferase
MKYEDKADIREDKEIRFIPGVYGVKEALLEGNVDVVELWISEGRHSSRIREILKIADRKDIPVFFKEVDILNDVMPGTKHQGIVALAQEFRYVEVEDLINESLKAPGYTLLIGVDHITDEGNLGAVIRTAVFFGVQGIILPKDRSAKISANMIKRSAGTYVHLPVARVVNLARALDKLKKRGFWIIGAAGEGKESIYKFEWKRDLVLILGNEYRGLSPLIKDKCHQLVSIPSLGKAEALNVSVAAGVILSEIVRQRTQR